MSIEVQNWALQQQLPPGNSTAKHVLTIIGNQASEDPRHPGQQVAFPSVEYLVWATGQNRKTVLANIKRLVQWRLIEDTGRRLGRTKQVVIYRVNCGPDLFHEQSRNRNRSDIGTVPVKPPPQWREGKSTEIGTVPKSEQYRNQPERVPILGHGTKSIAFGGEARAEAREADSGELTADQVAQLVEPFDLPEGIDPAVFARFVKHREEKRLPLSGQTWFMVRGDLVAMRKAGADPNQALKDAITRGWAAPSKPDDARGSPGRGGAPPKRVATDFSNVHYGQGTPDEQLPEFLRETAADA